MLAAVGVLDSTITVGGDATYLISETGVAAAAATSVADTADASAVFSGETGGFIDGIDATNVDFTAGGTALLEVQVANSATATATSTAADATAIGLIGESYGLQDIGVRVGSSGTLNANVDADVASTASTIGSLGIAADATANAEATKVAAISGLGDGTSAATSDFVFGDNATITANAGTSADRVSLSAVASNVGGTGDGDATATVDSTAIAGITADAGSDGVVSNVLSVGADAAITARAYVDGNAKAVSVAGDATAATNLAAVDGLQADTVIAGDDASLKAYANTLSAASAASTDLSATASNTLGDSRAIQLDNLTIGDSAILAGSYGVIGAASANLTTAASSFGDDSGDLAQASGSSGSLIGVQLGDGIGSRTADVGLSAGGSLSLAGTADLTSAATASAIDGGAMASSQSTTRVSGVALNEAGASAIGSGGTILASGSVNLDANATNVGTAGGFDDAIANATTQLVEGLALAGADSSLTIGDGGSITASAVVAADATAISVDAGAVAVAGGVPVAGGGDAYGINSPVSDLTIGGAGSINATVTTSNGASASTVAGDAMALAVPNYTEALYSGDVSIGAGGSITAAANTTAKADASSVAGSSDAVANAVTSIGFEALGAVNVGAAGSINATATSLLQAFADSIGDDSDLDHSEATASINQSIGFLGDEANTSIGAGGSLFGASSLTSNAAASGVQADVTGQSLVGRNLGIDLGQGINTPVPRLSVGADGTVSGSATGNTSAAAKTTNGDALAVSDVNLTAGLGSGDGVVTIGANGTASGTASAIGTAIAAAIDADGDSSYPDSDVEAIVSNDLVSGIDLGILEIGGSGAITATALSSQTATASNVGDPNPLDDTTVRASTAERDAITGLDSTAVSVGADLSKFSVGAQLSASATASTINSIGTATDPSARAVSGLGSAVIGIDASDLSLGRTVTAVNGLRADAISNLSASASGVAGAAEAAAGDGASRVIAINSSDLTVGDNANTTAVAASTLSATASSIAGEANAAAAQNADGLRNSAIAIGNDGNVIGQATLVGNASATTVGSQLSPADANADLTLLSSGIDQSGGATIVIGDTGNVSGTGFASGSASALTIDGNADANGLIAVQGMDLRSGGSSDITIQGSGNITGLAVIGSLNPAGSLGSPVTVSATSTAGTADANGDFDAEGIAGLEDLDPLYLDPTLLIAGPLRGDVSGQAIGGGQVSAITIGTTLADTATATNASSQLFGLQNVDIEAGMTGANLVKGTALGDFDVTATSVAGDTKASSNTDVYGIFDGAANGNITLSGGVIAIAQLTNNASANSIGGSASSEANGAAAALYGYDVTLINNGTLGATAISNTGSLASSVAGAARA